MARGEDVCYYANGKGYWLRREWKPQCSARVFLSSRCQGVKGHEGVHWCFAPSGDFDWDDNDDDPQEGGCSGSTPPGNEAYLSPTKMQKHYHGNYYTDAQVTDQAILAMLEKGKTPERGAAIDRPFTKEKRKYLHLVISARTRKTVIWIIDRKGFPVQEAIGKLDTNLLPGTYAVEFGRGKLTYPIKLKRDSEYKQLDLEKGPTCKRRIPKIDDDWSDD